MPAQPQIIGGTIGPEGAATAGAAAEMDLLSVSALGANTTADRWWKFTPSADASVNFDAMLSFTSTSTRDSLDPGLTISVYQAGDLVTPIVTASSGTDPQQGSVARGSVAVVVEAGVTYYIALTGVADSYRILRVSDPTDVGPWQTIPDAEYVQVIAPEGMTVEPVNFTGTYDSVVLRSNKTIAYGVAPAFAGPAPYLFPAAWDCAWQNHLNPCYVVVNGQLWTNPTDAVEWTGSGVCKVPVPPGGPTLTGPDFISATVAWENRSSSSGDATGRHAGTGYRIFHDDLLAEDPGPTGLGDLPPAPPGATLQWEDDDPSSVLTLEIAATDDGTGDGEVAFRRFSGGYGMDADGNWFVGQKPSGELLISGYDGTVSWQPFSLEEGDVSKVVGISQYVENNETPPAPSSADLVFGEERHPELAFRLTWDARRYRWTYPPVVPPTVTGFPPLRIFGRSDGATHGPRRVLGGGNTRQGGSRTLGSIL